jgi:hypothetical protein
MSDAGGWPGEETAPTELMALSERERRVLTALSVVGGASLSDEDLRAVADGEDVTAVVGGLEARGLVKSEEPGRYAVVGRVGEEIRRTDDALATGDRLMGHMMTLAQSGELTPERLTAEAGAILGLSSWAAERQQWRRLLELVKTLQSCFVISRRVDDWLQLLHRGRAAAQVLGDRPSEVWILQQLAEASSAAGEQAAAQQYRREAEQLQRGPQAGPTTQSTTYETAAAGGPGGTNVWLWVVGLVVALAAGIGAGWAIGSSGGDNGGPTAVTVVNPEASTVATTQTVTQSGSTVVSVSTSISTETVTSTVTTTTTTAAGIP